MAKEQTFKGRRVSGSKTAEEEKPRNPDGSREQKGYSGSADATGDQGNYNTDPSQATREQQQNQEAGRALDADTQAAAGGTAGVVTTSTDKAKTDNE